jgi:hypothetical protein
VAAGREAIHRRRASARAARSWAENTTQASVRVIRAEATVSESGERVIWRRRR